MSNPYVKDGNKKLLPSLVCYADILGFSQMSIDNIQKEKGNEFLRVIRRSLHRAYQRIRNKKSYRKGVADFYLKVFSDNIVIGYPVQNINFDAGEPELGRLFQILSEYQMNLAMDGFFIRGAIAFGQHYMDKDIVFGDALLEAHSLDDSGRPPRIVLANSMKGLIKRQISFYKRGLGAPQIHDLLQDSDNELFLNYLDEAFSLLREGHIFFECLESHKYEIERNLVKFTNCPNIKQKYEWVARYHNYICREVVEKHPIFDDPDQDYGYQQAFESAKKVLDFTISDCEGQTPRRIDTYILENL